MVNEKFMKCPGGTKVAPVPLVGRTVGWSTYWPEGSPVTDAIFCFPAAVTTWLIIFLIALDLWQIVVLLIEKPPPQPPLNMLGHSPRLNGGGVGNLFIFD